MKDIVLAEIDSPTTIELEGVEYDVNLSLGLIKGGDFWVKLEFGKVTVKEFNEIIALQKKKEALAIKSPLFLEKEYPITHIVVEKFKLNSNSVVEWECLSDDPNLNLEM